METQQTQESPQGQQSQQNNSFVVPDAYKDKGWVSSVKSADDLWKLTDNAQTLIGKRPAGIPANDAPDEEWNKFYTAFGRPEKPDAYKLNDPEGLPEGLDLAPIKAKASSILHEAGLNQKQADKIWQQFMKSELEVAGQNKAKFAETQANLDKEFNSLVKEHFGEKQDQVQQIATDFVNKYVPENMRSVYAELADNPKALVALQAAMYGAYQEIEKTKKEYGAEGKLPSGEQTTAVSIEDVRKELAQLRTSKEARDFTNPEHKKTMARIDELSRKVQTFYK